MSQFKALWVEEQEGGIFTTAIVERNVDDLPEGDLLIEVDWSSLNYKDALSAKGNKGVTRNYPHTPGIDAAGKVVSCRSGKFQSGDEVIVIGYDLGMNTAGGFGQRIRVPENWAVQLPKGLSLKDSMIIGTAGFTAALCIEKLLHMGLKADQGEVLVTGATGGVGIVAVNLLAQLGFTVAASTGKVEQAELLKQLGAASVIPRQELSEANNRPLLKERWAAAVDVVGGSTLVNIQKSLNYGASVACCGLVGSPELNATVFPLILRGINVLGVDSVNLPLATKAALWQRLATDWKPAGLNQLVTEISFAELIPSLDKVYKGEAVGRMVLKLGSQ